MGIEFDIYKNKWKVLPYPQYSTDIASCDYYWFRSMSRVLAQMQYHSQDDTENWLNSCIATQDED